MEEQKNPTAKWFALVIIIAVLGGLIAFMMSSRSGLDDLPPAIPQAPAQTLIPTQTPPPAQGQTTPTPTQTPTPDTTATPPSTQKSVYKDGTYSATGNYVAPGGPETIGVSLTVKNDVVTAVNVTPQARNGTSQNWQNYFAQGSNSIIGMKLDAIQIDSISGSSLTPIGFMDAVAKIKTQAQR